ncbi:MAG: hypothetical protein QF415_15780 [Candidatus Undinarchaeales archaeon]|nr:hypothetical protein [Candidatus Undinarchaeales archaeon]MDP7492545.1 hypothetical protein [Candidatus Undinarchaeales archaeon]
MEAEALFEFYGDPGSEGYDARSEVIDQALTDIGSTYDVTTQHDPLWARHVGEYGRGVILQGSEKDVLAATEYLVQETKEHGLPLNPAIDPGHPIAAWKGFRLSSYVIAKEADLDGHLDVAYRTDMPEGTLDELTAYATELSEKHGIEVKAHEHVQTYAGGYPGVVIPSETVGFYLSMDGNVNGIEGALREAKEKFDGTPQYMSDQFHPILSFRGKNVARAVDLEERE